MYFLSPIVTSSLEKVGGLILRWIILKDLLASSVFLLEMFGIIVPDRHFKVIVNCLGLWFYTSEALP